jgi:sulfite reductase alpha subunit-like flavoprotein
MSIPRRSFFSRLLHYTKDPVHLERLCEFTSPDLLDELYDYTTRPRRSILEVLSDFPSVRIPWQQVCAAIPPLRGRQFSIASGGALKTRTVSAPAAGPEGAPSPAAAAAAAAAAATCAATTRVDLLVGIVRYRTIIRRVRHGIATRYMAALRAGAQISVSLQAGGLFSSPAAAVRLLRHPVVMIAPGTGVAPVRALAWERWATGGVDGRVEGESGDGDALLFFGCRKKGCDDYFKDEWEGLGVRVWTAYSREQVSLGKPTAECGTLTSTSLTKSMYRI